MMALCAAALASCSATSDPITRLGLAPQPQAGGLAAAATEADDPVAAAGTDQPYFIVAEDDPELPEVASAVPSLQNRPEPAEAPQAESPQLASATQAPVAATLDERFAAGAEAAGQQTAGAAPVAQAGAAAIAAVQAAAPVESGSAFAAPPKKRGGFFASLFASEPAPPQRMAAANPRPLIASLGSAAAAPTQRAAVAPGALPGVREGALFEISRKTGTGDDDIDLMEDDDAGPVQLASAAGLARLAPNGLAVQTDRVDVACLKPSLVRVLKQVEAKYGKKVVVTSGYRSPPNNRRARGATNSLHMYCAAADIQVEGVTKFELAQFARSMPGRGGVGTYCHTNSVHIDVGPERDWNWRCRRKKRR